MRRTFATVSLAVVAVFAASPTQISAQQTARQPAAAQSNDALIVYSAGLEALAPDARDRGMVSALRMLEQRIGELPRETNQRDMPSPAIQLALQLLFSPMSLRAGLLPGVVIQPDMQPPPVYAQLDFYAPNQRAAETLAGRFAGTFAGMIPPGQARQAPDLPGMQMIAMGPMSLFHGATTIGDKAALTVAFNRVDKQAIQLGAFDLPQGVQPTFAAVFDGARAKPFFDAMLDEPDREAELGPMRMQLEMMGLLGPDPARISGAIGHSADRGHIAMRYTNYRKILERTGMTPQRMLNASDLARVPADATYAQVSRYNVRGLLEVYLDALPEEARAENDPLAMVEAQTGVHPQRDLLDHLGQTVGFYMSDSTGGGGLLSMVGFVEVANADALNQSFTRLRGMLNQMAQQHAKGYVRIAERTVNDQAFTSLVFPGLPVPLEVSFAIADGFLYAAASPQALLAAIAQGKAGAGAGGGGGLMQNPRFRDSIGRNVEGAMQVTFHDTPRLLRDGYSIASLGAAALANAVRSPIDPARDPGMVIPSLNELAKGAQPTAYWARIQGDDLIVGGQFDRSWLALATGTVGVLGGTSGLAVPAMMAGVMLPALGKARESAKIAKAQIQLRQIAMAAHAYAADHNDKMPRSIDELIDGGYINEDMLHSPSGPASDGGADFWLDTTGATLHSVQFPDRRVLAYDRAMYARRQSVNVAYIDGHVETMNKWQFDELIKSPPNEGIDFDLP